MWASLCSSASAFLDQSPPCSVLYLPISLNNARKKRFSAGSLAGEFPEEIDAVDCNTESAIISSITRELNDCYCLHLPSDPSLQRDSESPLLEHGTGRLVLVGASHTSRMSALLPASLETMFLRLLGQSQTKDGVGNILAAIEELKLIRGDFLYIDLLSTAIFVGTDEDGLQIPPLKDGQKRWHVTGRLTACPTPRIKKILSMLDSLRELVGEATLICGLPLPRYVKEKCCIDSIHIENFSDNDYAEVFVQASKDTWTCLEAAFPLAIIFDQLLAFSGGDEDVALGNLISSAGMAIWSSGDPVHLTNTAYGDVAAALVAKLNNAGGDKAVSTTRKRIESVVTRVQTPIKSVPTPGWIQGDCTGPQRSRGGPGRGFGFGSGTGRGMPAGWRGTGVNRWNPY